MARTDNRKVAMVESSQLVLSVAFDESHHRRIDETEDQIPVSIHQRAGTSVVVGAQIGDLQRPRSDVVQKG